MNDDPILCPFSMEDTSTSIDKRLFLNPFDIELFSYAIIGLV